MKACAVYFNEPGQALVEHEVTVHCDTSARLAALLDIPFAGVHDPERHYPGPLYVIPHDTITSLDLADSFGISSGKDLFGGVVTEPFMGTKSISHGLSGPEAWAPGRWPASFGEQVSDCVLRGITAFNSSDALSGGAQLLEIGPVRIKPVRATAGRGQLTVNNRVELEQALEALDQDEIRQYGLVLEEFLTSVITFSVGCVEVGNLQAVYYGTQNLTRDNDGQMVYGGSELHVVRGGFEQLLAAEVPGRIRTAIAQAAAFDVAAQECLSGFFASRRNYDIAQGIDAHKRLRSGVLEQSWRIGGASCAEVAALERFHADPTLERVRTASVERYGADHSVPSSARLLYRGHDSQVGFISKYVMVGADDDEERSH